jgi:thermitase
MGIRRIVVFAATVAAVIGAAWLFTARGTGVSASLLKSIRSASGASEVAPSVSTDGRGNAHAGVSRPGDGARGDATNVVVGLVDRFAGATPLESRLEPSDRPGTTNRLRLVRSSSKYPLTRVVDVLETDPETGSVFLRDQRAMVGDHVVARLRDGALRSELDAVVSRHGFTIRRELRLPGCFLISVSPATLDSVPFLIETLGTAACVDVAEPDHCVTVSDTTPNDPSYGYLWGMDKIGMPGVWDVTTGTGGVVVAVFDTGTDVTHADLFPNLWRNPQEIPYNGLDDDGNGYIDDVYGWDFYDDDSGLDDIDTHGTHVAGTIGAVGNNGIGVTGVGWNIGVMTIKFFGRNGWGELEGYASDAMAGMYYVITQKIRGIPVRVTNHSWGGSGYSQILRDAMAVAGGYGIMHVAAAGNSGTLDNDIVPHYPASYTLSNLVAVANTTRTDGRHYGSHYGATSVDLGAPGESIYSTRPGESYGYKTGTSMATPHVSGVAALLFDYMPHLTWQQARRALFDGVDVIPALVGKCTTEGRLNAYATFEQVDPLIRHQPLENTTDVERDHIVEATIRPGAPLLDTNRVVVLWNMDGSTNQFTTNVMQQASNDIYRAAIPTQSEGTTIHYMIRAETETGRVATHPADAPGTLHSFEVTYPVPVWTYGDPAEHGTVFPPYGRAEAPWGSTVTATASLHVAQAPDRRQLCIGWYGGGNVPPTGTSNVVSFVIREFSAIIWRWQEQFSLVQTSQHAAEANAVTWWNAGSAGETVTAPALVDVGGTNFAFVNWLVDGARYPGPGDTAMNPATGIAMSTSHQATAVYMPAATDSDGDSLPDWWEMFNFANLESTATNDPDGDGYSNEAELADRADPRDAASIPTGPVIVHTPLEQLTGTLPPWEIAATVTDRVGVASVQLLWQRNDGPWTNVPMSYAGGDNYAAEIMSAQARGDEFAYRIVSEDTVSNVSSSALHTFAMAYPLVSATPTVVSASLYPKGTATTAFRLDNDGNGDLVWSALTNWSDAISADAEGWSHSGANDEWHVSSQKAHSGDYSWFCGNELFGQYAHLQDASLVTPPVTLGATPGLSFWQWAEMEIDSRDGWEGYYWDAGVVDISTDDGATFDRIVPVGGYPYKVTPNDDSPFPDHTPCLGGQGGWEQVSFDLAAYAGKTVRIRFRFGSDRYTSDLGWYVDDVIFSWGDDWLDLPVMSGTVPASDFAYVAVELDAMGLEVGSYQSMVLLACNDPGHPTIIVPVYLAVVVDRPPAVSLSSTQDDTFVVTWASTSDRVYDLMLSTNLANTNGWVGVPEYTNLPGTGGTMSYIGNIDHITPKFYRIQESQP